MLDSPVESSPSIHLTTTAMNTPLLREKTKSKHCNDVAADEALHTFTGSHKDDESVEEWSSEDESASKESIMKKKRMCENSVVDQEETAIEGFVNDSDEHQPFVDKPRKRHSKKSSSSRIKPERLREKSSDEQEEETVLVVEEECSVNECDSVSNDDDQMVERKPTRQCSKKKMKSSSVKSSKANPETARWCKDSVEEQEPIPVPAEECLVNGDDLRNDNEEDQPVVRKLSKKKSKSSSKSSTTGRRRTRQDSDERASDCTAETECTSTTFERDFGSSSSHALNADASTCLESAIPEEDNASVGSMLLMSSIKASYIEEETFVSNSKKSWKTLPPPDLTRIKTMSRNISSESYLHKDPTTQQQRRKTVSFASVQIREYDLTLGDNPSVSYGPPISLDWDYQERAELDVDEYETNRGPRRKLRQMLLNYYQRKNILVHTYGHSEASVKEAQKETIKVKNQRAITKTFLQLSKVEEFCESAKRKAKRGFKKKK